MIAKWSDSEKVPLEKLNVVSGRVLKLKARITETLSVHKVQKPEEVQTSL